MTSPYPFDGRHPVEALVATGRNDEAHLREGLNAIGPKLAVVGLRVNLRKIGVRIGKAKSSPVAKG